MPDGAKSWKKLCFQTFQNCKGPEQQHKISDEDKKLLRCTTAQANPQTTNLPRCAATSRSQSRQLKPISASTNRVHLYLGTKNTDCLPAATATHQLCPPGAIVSPSPTPPSTSGIISTSCLSRASAPLISTRAVSTHAQLLLLNDQAAIHRPDYHVQGFGGSRWRTGRPAPAAHWGRGGAGRQRG